MATGPLLILVPLAEYQVDYTSARGRPYSSFERLILAALAEGDQTLDQLESTFLIHRRLLVESLVTLTLAGWVAFTGAGLTLTVDGRAAAEATRAPRVRLSADRVSYILMERLTGIFAAGRVQYATSAALKQDGLYDRALKLHAQIHLRNIDSGRIDRLLRRDRDEWIERIKNIHQRRRDGIWLKVEADPVTGRVFNLPEPWLHLDTAVRQALARDHDIALHSPQLDGSGEILNLQTAEIGPRARELAFLLGSLRSTPVREHTLITDGPSHQQFLLQVLSSARRNVVIVSSFVRVSALDALRPHILDSVRRGVSVALLIGLEGDKPTQLADATDQLKRLAFDARQLSGRFEFSAEGIGTHAKVLFWDDDQGSKAAIGSFNWLSSVGVADYLGAANLSFVLEEPRTLAGLARTIATWWEKSRPGRRAAISAMLKRSAGDLERAALEYAVPPGCDQCEIAIVRDTEHRLLLAQLLKESTNRLAVLSHKFSDVGAGRLSVQPTAASGPAYRRIVGYGEMNAHQIAPSELISRLQNAAWDVRSVSRLHSKLIVGDLNCYLGSYNLLSSDPYDTGDQGSELGVFLSGHSISDRLWRYVEMTVEQRP